MKIIVVGIGRAGLSLIDTLSKDGYDITVIEKSEKIVKSVTDRYNVAGVVGSGASRETLLKAGANTADLLIALTAVDEVNLLSCMQAKNLGTQKTAARLLLKDLAKERDELKKEYSIDYIISPKVDIANLIAANVGLPGNVKLEGVFGEEIQMLTVNVLKESPFAGKSLMDVKSSMGSPVLVVAVVRNEKLIVPDGGFVCEPGDDIYVIADARSMHKAFEEMGIVKNRARRVLIVGGGLTCEYVTKLLLEAKKEVNILDGDLETCHRLMEKFPSAKVMYGDGEEIEVLEEDDVEKMDVVISMTDKDETNLVVSIFAWAKGIPSIITRVDSPGHVRLLHKTNMDITVSPSEIATNKLVRFIKNYEVGGRENEILRFYSICDGLAEIMEFTVKEDCMKINVEFMSKDFKLKKDTLIAAIIRDNEVIIPNGHSVLKRDDRVVVISSSSNHIIKLNDIFK